MLHDALQYDSLAETIYAAIPQRGKKRRRSAEPPLRAPDKIVGPAEPAAKEEEVVLTAASFYIPSLPGLDPSTTLTLFGGHIPSAPPEYPSDAHLFFFLARARHIAEKEKLVIWFNGGPGCSSFDGALMEIGPLRMQQGTKGKIVEQEGAWNEYANVLFIDQPAGTGYSYVSNGKYVSNGDEAAQHVMTFMTKFYQVFPEFKKMDTYIAGESFAGTWIPIFADAILKNSKLGMPLRGLLIGNGWIDGWHQYPAFIQFAYDEGIIKPGTPAAARVEAMHERCEKRKKDFTFETFPINENQCEGILRTITDTTIQTVNGQKVCINNYDVRLTDTHPACGMNWPNLLSDMYAYLPLADTKAAFHASNKPGGWRECNGQVSGHFYSRTKSSVHLIPDILSKIPILHFSGMQDLICNHLGSEWMFGNMTWNGEKGFGNVTVDQWYVDNQYAGTWRTARNLTYVQVANSSHMVPFDLPIVAHDMLTRFINTDLLSAAGAAARVPSRVGNEQAVIVGELNKNGTTASDTITAPDSTLSAGALPEGASASGGEAYYNLASALFVLLLLAGGGCIFYIISNKAKFMKQGLLPFSRRSSRRPADDSSEMDELVANQEQRDGGTHPRYAKRLSTVDEGAEMFEIGEEEDEEAQMPSTPRRK